MSTYLYDNAFVEDLRNIIRDDRISILPPSNMFNVVALTEEDKIQLPVISLQRPNWSIIDDRISHAQIHSGIMTSYDEDTERFKSVQTIPIRINYLIDVWTKNRETNDNIMRELIWYYTTHPTLSIKIPYGLDIDHNFNIFLDSDIEDNSDIVEHNVRGIYFRQTLTAYTDDAYLWKSSSRYPKYVDAEVVINNE